MDSQDGKLHYLESIIENITDIITILEVDGKIRYESSSITAVLGYLPSEMIGKSAFDFIHPSDYKKVFSVFMKAILRKEAVEKVEMRFRHKDGSWKYLECLGRNLLFDSVVRGVVVCSRDITERRASEGRMRLQAAALEATANGIMITDVSGLILWVNEAFSKMTGYALQEAVGKTPRILKSGEQTPSLYEELWRTILSGEPWTGELINRRKDSTLYFERKKITPVKNSEGQITNFIAIMEDISSDKKLEAQFRQAQKMEAVGRLSGGVAHDFNNLLTVILGQCDLLMNRLSPSDKNRDSVSEIRIAGMRAASLTRQLLAFSRKQILQTKVVDLNEIVLGCDKMIRRLLGEDIEFVTIFGTGMKKIRVDTSQIEQVIMNLAVNARDAMPKGGKIIVETSLVQVSAAEASRYPGFVPGEYVKLKVQDTGCGISEEIKVHLFEPFFTTKEKGKGTGLGLATIYGIVKQSHGYVYVDSEPGKGAAFSIYFPPVLDAELSPAHLAAAPLELPRGTETILVAEDEDLVRGLAVQVLSKQGFHVLEARNGLDALNIARKQRDSIDALITDIVMPYMGGGELAEKFSAVCPNAEIVFTSGYTDHTAVNKWIQQGCKFIQKPYTYGEFLLTLRDVLDKKPRGNLPPA